MDLHNLPTDLVLDDHHANMDPHMLLDADRSPKNLLFNTAEAVATDKALTDSAEEGRVTSQDIHHDEQSTSNEPLAPLDDRIQALYNTYHTSYAFPISESSAHMQHAKDLALALLQRHYPAAQGYFVEPAALGPLSAKGINFVLKEDNEPDSDPDTLPPMKQSRAARKSVAHYSYSAPWHHIAPEHMAAFVVKKRVSDTTGEVEHMTDRTHTCLVIVLDDLATFHRWSRDNVNHRGDVLCDMLGVLGGIERGCGMLFFGHRLELYRYDAGNDAQPVRPAQTKDWRMDMRSSRLAEIDNALRDFSKHDVVYRGASN